MDKRIKLTTFDKEEIRKLKGLHTQQYVADLYSVSRRTIEFIWFPEREEENKRRRVERGGWKQYYNLEKSREYQFRYINNKKEEE